MGAEPQGLDATPAGPAKSDTGGGTTSDSPQAFTHLSLINAVMSVIRIIDVRVTAPAGALRK